MNLLFLSGFLLFLNPTALLYDFNNLYDLVTTIRCLKAPWESDSWLELEETLVNLLFILILVRQSYVCESGAAGIVSRILPCSETDVFH